MKSLTIPKGVTKSSKPKIRQNHDQQKTDNRIYMPIHTSQKLSSHSNITFEILLRYVCDVVVLSMSKFVTKCLKLFEINNAKFEQKIIKQTFIYIYRTPNSNRGQIRRSGGVSTSCSNNRTRRTTHVNNSLIGHDRRKDGM